MRELMISYHSVKKEAFHRPSEKTRIMSISNTPIEEMKSIIDAQRDYFASNVTLDRKFRKEQLKKLQQALLKWEKPLCDALWTDLHKSEEEAVMTELSIVSGEIKNHLSHLRCWMKSRRVSTPLKMMPSCSRIGEGLCRG
mgnify:CR=1 FL=1